MAAAINPAPVVEGRWAALKRKIKQRVLRSVLRWIGLPVMYKCTMHVSRATVHIDTSGGFLMLDCTISSDRITAGSIERF